MNKLNLCYPGNPKDSKTWSGTPFHIYTELNRVGKCNKAFSSKLSPLAEKYLSKLAKVCFLNSSNSERIFIQRILRSKKVRKNTTGDNSTLHLSTLDLPFIILPKQNHYLYCDYTWNLLSINSTLEKRTSRLVKIIADEMERKSYQQVSHIFTISEYVKKNIINYYKIPKQKITVVGTGLGVIKPYFGEKDYLNHKILFAAKGRFRDKGGELVLRAFKYVLNEIPDAKLTIVGQNEYTDFTKEPNIATYGFIPIDQLQEIFNTNSLFLMPAYNEPWGLVYLEAMACRMPIIGLNRNSFPEISGYGEYGYGLDEGNPEQLAHIIINAFKEPDVIAEIGDKAQQNCLKKYTWENVVRTITNKIDIIEK